ncbi:Spo0E family sporulation regulatory protein-aspartic acid phosphatase [Mobilitalea sibirica]|uniref:Spo0E family sporulation regulatory protein-aspartic acid phosphatase n=1 Tax=Mobilitalea sibirica TaxID=1462919 RepID=A0A8J7HCE0_9FIRM|nr:Spo0E family sporulation regulatory protein-aspartic acid phosphatase [Mobilitalea sibirica]MBH1942260.1 Spo0E family sporulation regulatory protein-aspartic acid phosphatase [Mobilitalea sibirica]
MSNRSDLLEMINFYKSELNTAVSHNISLNDEQLIILSQRIDDLVFQLSRKD